MIAFACPKCAKPYHLKPEFAGRKTTCSGCKEPLLVPTPEVRNAPEATGRISFSCTKCGMKFNLLAEFSGRKTTCPACKEPLVVPAPDQTGGNVPPAGQIEGPSSSLAQAAVDAGVTLGEGGATGLSSVRDLMAGRRGTGARYVIEKELARGGMGAILSAIDCDIRREVAVKYLLDQSNEKSKVRFVEEAQITGQLEHPNIVPIHELGVDAQKRLFFTMKIVKGRSLAQVITLLRDQPAEAEKEYTLGRLLNILVNVCNGLAYAHARGVVHRDLKPANIMVGDFGEVYVMDWGLAKVLDQSASLDTNPPMAIPVATLAQPIGESNPPHATPVVLLATPVEAAASPAPSFSAGSGRVVTSREGDADLTQDGAVLGTPVYMPPEQAAGKIDEIDERSDIYSMGAILYEILTLQPPIDKTGGFWPIVLRVSQGQIDPPEKKAPERARAGKIPVELAAVAMKALARNKGERYQTVELLRKDIERFLEGRSVSAKHDTIREMAVKLVRRNKGVSIATAAAAVVLLIGGVWSLIAILNANARTRDEQQAKVELAKKSVPTFVRAAKLHISETEFDEALNQVNTAITFDDADPEARFVRAQLLMLRQDYAAARIDLEVCLKHQPQRSEAEKLLALARDARRDDKATLLALAEEFGRQKTHTLAAQATRNAEKLIKSKIEMLQVFQVRIEAVWPGQERGLTLDNDGKFHMAFAPPVLVSSLEPLRGIPLSSFTLSDGARLIDLTPLKGMPLVELRINNSPVADLTPLQGAPLEVISLGNCANVSDLKPLKGMRLRYLYTGCDFNNTKLSDLSPLEWMPITTLNLRNCRNVSDLSPLKGMPLTVLELMGCQVKDLGPLRGMRLKKLDFGAAPGMRDLSPLKDMPLTELTFDAPGVSDLSPLAGMKLTLLDITSASLLDLSPLKGIPLTRLTFHQCETVADLAPLKGMPLTILLLYHCKVSDLSPLKGMKLTDFAVHSPLVKDLEPLTGMPLVRLDLRHCSLVRDLSPLRNMKLVQLFVSESQVGDLDPLRGMPLLDLRIGKSRVANLTPLKGMKLISINMDECPVTDLSPLAGMPIQQIEMNECKDLHDLRPLAGMKLTNISLPPVATKGIEAVRRMDSLQYINGMAPQQFWKLRDAAKAKGK